LRLPFFLSFSNGSSDLPALLTAALQTLGFQNLLSAGRI
jgi:hypothetical protein